MKQTLLNLEHIQKRFADKVVLQDLNLELKAGEFLCLLGPSGCGKSTLLRIMAGLEKVNQGQVKWQIPLGISPTFGFVFQDSELLSWRTALENVRLPLELQKGTDQDSRALAALEKVGLKSAASLFPHELSGGMRMRVSIARALASEPKVLFLDEPFSALDEVTRFDLQTQLRRLSEEEHLTVVFVTHSSQEAAFLADRVLLMSQQGGRFILNETLKYDSARNETLRKSNSYQDKVSAISDSLREAFR